MLCCVVLRCVVQTKAGWMEEMQKCRAEEERCFELNQALTSQLEKARAEHRALSESVEPIRAENKRLSEQTQQLIDHINQNRKIKYLSKIKEENDQLHESVPPPFLFLSFVRLQLCADMSVVSTAKSVNWRKSCAKRR